MTKTYDIKNGADLSAQLRSLKQDLNTRESNLKQNAKTYMMKLPSSVLERFTTPTIGVTADRNIKTFLDGNIVGKFLPTLVKRTFLRKAGFINKFVGGLIAKKIGKVIDNKFLK